MVGSEGPADGEGTGLHFTLGPAIEGLGVELAELGVTGRGYLAVGGAAIGEAGGGFQALGFPLDGATLAVAPCLAQVVAPFGLADVAVSEHAATGQQRQRCREMGESDICCHTFLCSVMWAVTLAGEFPETRCCNPAILDSLSLDRRLCVLAFQPVCQMTTERIMVPPVATTHHDYILLKN